MSLPVELAALRDRMAEHGPVAYLVTVREDGSPHVVSVVVGHDGERLLVSAGRTTGANLRRHPAATLLWPNGPDPAYSMLVDCAATAFGDDGEVVLEPRSAVLHRVAAARGDGPTCAPIGEPPGRP